jgi:LysM repeat protein
VAAAPSSASPAKPAERPAATSYTVKKGDTAYGIARRSGVKVADLLRQNGIKDPAALRPGQTLNITVRR